MSLTIGRASISADPGVLDCDGDSLSVAGWFTGSDLNHAKALRQQLLGLANNPDEPVVPFTSTVDTALDGFYRVMSVRVTPVHGVSYHSFKFQYAVDLERIGGYANPVMELSASLVEYDNPHTITTYGRVAFPDSGWDFDSGSFSYGANMYAAVEGGYVRWFQGDPPTAGTARYYVEPADFYIGAATIEIKYGSTYYPVHGLNIPRDVSNNWRISNGLVRASIYESATNDWSLKIEYYDSGSWVDLVNLDRGTRPGGVWTRGEFGGLGADRGSGPAQTVPNDPAIIANSPARVTVNVPNVEGFETFSLARGAAWIDGSFGYFTNNASTAVFGLGATSAIAVTDSTNRMQRTSADANGNKFFVGLTAANSVDTTNGRIYLDSAAASVTYVAGLEAVLESGGANTEALYAFASPSVTQRVVLR